MNRKIEVEKYVRKKIRYITVVSKSGRNSGSSGAGFMLATLRRGVGGIPGEDPGILGLILTDMPEDFFSKADAYTGICKPTEAEWACYTALTLYALHQQGNDPTLVPMHMENRSLGTAMAMYAYTSGDANAVSRMVIKLKTLASAKDMEEFSYHLKTVVRLLKGKSIALDYGRLAGDIYQFQFFDSRSDLFLKWGQDYYSNKNSNNKDSEGGNKNGEKFLS